MATMTLEELERTTEFLALTSNQKSWLRVLLQTNDPMQATQTVYPKARKLGHSYAAQLSGKLQSSPNVRAALSKYFGWDDRTKFLADLDAQIHKAKKGSSNLVSLLALKAKLLGLTDDAAVPVANEEQTNRFPIGSTIEQDGRLFRVEAVPVAR